ncbi:MAG: threonine dehydrogenase-like Zn-dependent dehydrogenase [Planctomycetota bacterium]
MSERPWTAIELQADGSLRPGRYDFVEGKDGWMIHRNGEEHLALESTYKLLATISCGVCATDLARKFLPFPLPQVIGHEVLAQDEQGQRFVLDINASCLSLASHDLCEMCVRRMPTHCRNRLTLGINQLPGGFGPWVLVPPGAMFEVPPEMPDDTAVLTEPFAAALRAVDTVQIQDGDSVCVLGPRRLGMLLIAALDGRRDEMGRKFNITAMVRRRELEPLARQMGADDVVLSTDNPLPKFDVVFDTSGNPQALELAASLARRELHLKSTHGQGAVGLNQLTGFVVDEFAAHPVSDSDHSVSDLATVTSSSIGPLGMCPEILVSSDEEFDRAVRAVDGEEASWLIPRGRIRIDRLGTFQSPLLLHIVERELIVSSSRCGDFAKALKLMNRNGKMRSLGAALVSHRFAREDLAAAMSCAASQDAIKVVVDAEG